jgi:uridine kinase
MKKPYVIAINAVSGGGKTALARLLVESLPKAALFCFDDFDATNVYPDNFYEWSRRGGDPSEFDCPGMADAVTRELQQSDTEFIVLDYPFGRDHPRFQELIDLSVFVDTPLDVAMARRILRDFGPDSKASTQDRLEKLRDELSYYLEKARHPYLDTFKHRASCDLILDGWTTLENLRDAVLNRIGKAKGR